jgi:hypothetical protein
LYEGFVEGVITLTVSSPRTSITGSTPKSVLTLPLRVRIVPTPPRSKRLLWDQFHSLHYPLAYFPRDTLWQKVWRSVLCALWYCPTDRLMQYVVHLLVGAFRLEWRSYTHKLSHLVQAAARTWLLCRGAWKAVYLHRCIELWSAADCRSGG